MYKNNYANDIIKQIKLWDKNNTTNSTKYINRKNGIEDILILYDKFFKELIKQDNTAYMVYGSFYKNAIKTKVNQDIKIKYNNFIIFSHI